VLLEYSNSQRETNRSRYISQPATAGTSIPCANLASHPRPYQASYERKSITVFARPDPDRLKQSTMRPTSPGQPPSQVSGNHLPRSGTPWVQGRTIIDSQIKRCRKSACLPQTYTTATGYLKQSRRRAITHSETLYHDPHLWDRATVYCLVRRCAWPGSTQQAASLTRPPASI